ncbi:hypothetical protein Bca101_059798 [Brassica carinata]
MDIPELSRRIHTLGEEPPAAKSISWHTGCSKLHTGLKNALDDDEYNELKESKLGVFIKFQELGFGWTSRLVHYILAFQLNIKKKYELMCLVGPQPVRFSLLEFENLTVDVEAVPPTQQIIKALERCEGWSRDDHKRLGYLAILTGYIEGRKDSTPTRASLAGLVMELERFENYPWGRVAFKVMMDALKGKDITGCYTIDGFAQALQIWVYTALPELGANYGNPIPNRPSPPILAYMGGKGCRCFKDAICRQTTVINFVHKDISEMFPKWDSDVEDPATENVIKIMYNQRPWKWTMDCWEVTGKKARTETTAVPPTEAHEEASEEVPTEARSEVTTTVGGMTKEDIERCFKDIADAMREGFGTCLKEIKYLSDTVEAVKKKVGITKKRKWTSSNDLQNTTSNDPPPPKPAHEPGVSTSPNTSQKIFTRQSRKNKN